MAYTEEEAKEKLCPFVAGHDPQRDMNKRTFHHSQTCVGTACMAWQPVYPDHRQDDQMLRGYCGLAGAQS